MTDPRNRSYLHRFADACEPMIIKSENILTPPDRPKRLECCCCGQLTVGRQWWNRDTGYGLCDGCIGINGVADLKIGETASSFGIRSVHWGLTQPEATT